MDRLNDSLWIGLCVSHLLLLQYIFHTVTRTAVPQIQVDNVTACPPPRKKTWIASLCLKNKLNFKYSPIWPSCLSILISSVSFHKPWLLSSYFQKLSMGFFLFSAFTQMFPLFQNAPFLFSTEIHTLSLHLNTNSSIEPSQTTSFPLVKIYPFSTHSC